MKILYLDCFSGISGDMTLGALLNLGIDIEEFKERLGGLNLEGYRLEVKKGQRKGVEGLKVDIIDAHNHRCVEHEGGHPHHAGADGRHHGAGGGHHHRNIHDIREIVEGSRLSPFVRERSMNIFESIAAAEGKIHGKPPGEVHFHEVGAVDSIVDVVGACICIQLLEVDRIMCSHLNVGGGFVECAHGIFPVPAPATLEILKGVPIYSSGAEGELVTPTGAAIVKEFVSEYTAVPSMKVRAVGYGLGSADRPVPNVLRAMMGDGGGPGGEEAWVLETNIDDMNPQFYSPLMDEIFSLGAYDVFLTPVIMKKGRPGIKLSVICGEGEADGISESIIRNTTTLGVRRYKTSRDVLDREMVTLDTPYGKVDIKIGRLPGGGVKYSPEYDHLAGISKRCGVPLLQLYQEVSQIAKNCLTKG